MTNMKTFIHLHFLLIILSGTLHAQMASTADKAKQLQGELLRYDFDRDTTEATDKTGNGNSGKLFGCTIATSGIGKGACSFATDNDFLMVGGQGAITGSMTVAMSVYVTEKPKNLGLPLFTSGVPGNGDFLFIGGGNPKEPLFLAWDHWGTGGLRSSKPLSFRRWVHVAMTYDASNNLVNFYMNGTLVQTVQGLHYPCELKTCVIGGNLIGGSTTAHSFRGFIDDVRLFDRCLTTAEIAGISKQARKN